MVVTHEMGFASISPIGAVSRRGKIVETGLRKKSSIIRRNERTNAFLWKILKSACRHSSSSLRLVYASSFRDLPVVSLESGRMHTGHGHLILKMGEKYEKSLFAVALFCWFVR